MKTIEMLMLTYPYTFFHLRWILVYTDTYSCPRC